MPILKNARHERFAQEYAKGKSAAEAYRLAGYKYSRSTATRLRKNQLVQARVAELQKAAADRAELTIEGVLRELSLIGFANIQDYMKAGPDGDPVLDVSMLTREQAAALAVTVEDVKHRRGGAARDFRRVKFKLHDKQAALVNIGKHLGMFVERHEHTGKDGGAMEVRSVTDRDRAMAILLKLEKAKRERTDAGGA